ncbi:hypothetical protein J6590_090138 [Homalodisca vitripennis]|nr:hypothetical protein J6590_090138 [Homalodisca vitripennis]
MLKNALWKDCFSSFTSRNDCGRGRLRFGDEEAPEKAEKPGCLTYRDLRRTNRSPRGPERRRGRSWSSDLPTIEETSTADPEAKRTAPAQRIVKVIMAEIASQLTSLTQHFTKSTDEPLGLLHRSFPKTWRKAHETTRRQWHWYVALIPITRYDALKVLAVLVLLAHTRFCYMF